MGEEGEPLSTYDFPSDENSRKEVARTMLRTLGVINDSLDTVERSGPGDVDFGERSLNSLGYQFLGNEETAAAISVFQLNTEQFPESANVWDSLAEGYLTDGQVVLAEEYYRKSLELDPENENATQKLREIESGG